MRRKSRRFLVVCVIGRRWREGDLKRGRRRGEGRDTGRDRARGDRERRDTGRDRERRDTGRDRERREREERYSER